MFRVTTIRAQGERAARVIRASGGTLPGPIGFLFQAAALGLLVLVVLAVAIPVLVVGAVLALGGLVMFGLRASWRALRLGVRDDGRRNVRVIEPGEPRA